MKEQIRFGYRIRGDYLHDLKDYSYRKLTDTIVIHCSATSANQNISAETIRRWHVMDRGFMDIGYHFVIDREGVIERGRPPMAVAAGEPRDNMNRRALHICMVGGLSTSGVGEDNFTEAQWKTLNFLVHEAAKAYGITRVIGHRDIKGVRKDCPSFDVRRWWGSAPEPELGLPVDGETQEAPLFN